MDFFKKKMKELLDDDKDKEKAQEHDTNDHARGDGDHGQAQSYYNQPGHSGPPPQHGYGGPPPPGPQLAPGWNQQWDQNSQRWYYVEQATGRTQWEPPAFSHGPPQGPPPSSGYSQGYGHGYPGAYGTEEHDRGMFGHGVHEQYGEHEKDKDKKSSALKYGLGGAAVGALAGGVIAHEMTETSDDEGHHVTQSTTYAAPAAVPDPYATMPPQAPTENEDGESISSSDKEEIEERREKLEEAQEEYNEAVEEGYES